MRSSRFFTLTPTRTIRIHNCHVCFRKTRGLSSSPLHMQSGDKHPEGANKEDQRHVYCDPLFICLLLLLLLLFTFAFARDPVHDNNNININNIEGNEKTFDSSSHPVLIATFVFAFRHPSSSAQHQSCRGSKIADRGLPTC